jgi:hypothetical protein
MLLPTLYDYLMATGAEGAGIVVIVHGHRIELGLSRLRNPPEQQSAFKVRSPARVGPGRGSLVDTAGQNLPAAMPDRLTRVTT